jgi:serine protease Do
LGRRTQIPAIAKFTRLSPGTAELARSRSDEEVSMLMLAVAARRSHLIAATLAAALTAAGSTCGKAESLIEEATRHTVKLRVSVEYPFIGERRGTFNGTGFVVDRERGWIVTNAHMAKYSPSKIRIIFKDRDPIVGKKLYVDDHIDVAIVEVPVDSIPDWAKAARLGCTDEAVPGQQVVAFGHPWGLDFTATRGIVSGTRFLNRSEAIQTDAAINPGNSGGALIDAETRKVIGINEATWGNNRGTIGLVIPTKLVCTIVDLLKEGKDPAPPKLPATFATTTMDRELYVASVSGPWQHALESGDRIVAINGDRTRTYISRIIDQTRGRDTVELTYSRGGAEHAAKLAIPPEKEVISRKGLVMSGMLIGESPYAEGERDALHVHFVAEASDADIANFRQNDQIISIDGTRISSLEQARELMSEKRGQKASFIVRRRASANELTYTLHMRKLELGPPLLVN